MAVKWGGQGLAALLLVFSIEFFEYVKVVIFRLFHFLKAAHAAWM